MPNVATSEIEAVVDVLDWMFSCDLRIIAFTAELSQYSQTRALLENWRKEHIPGAQNSDEDRQAWDAVVDVLTDS